MKKIYLILLVNLFLKNSPAQNFQEMIGTPFLGVSYGAAAFSDIDNDLDQDILIAGADSLNNPITLLYKNDGSGNYTLFDDSTFIKVWGGSIAFSDIDNDNDQDVLISGNNTGNVFTRLYKNNGNGEYTEVSGTPFQGVQKGSINFADIDNDNDNDVLITGRGQMSNEQYAKLYLNNGIGDFTEVTGTPFTPVEKSSVAFSDVDNDNDEDVLIIGNTGTMNSSSSKLFLNDGNGTFTEALGMPFVQVENGGLAFSDVDNDNDEDVLIIGSSGSSFQQLAKLYLNDGSANFIEDTGTPFLGFNSRSLGFVDIDNDNNNDVIIIEGGATTPSITKLYKNDGNGAFSEEMDTSIIHVVNSTMNIADIDNDSYQDILITGYNSTSGKVVAKLYRNLYGIATGINDEIKLNSNLDIYPNPTSNQLTIATESKISEIKIIDISGKIIKTITKDLNVVNVTDLSKGIYFIKVITEERTITKKFVKQ